MSCSVATCNLTARNAKLRSEKVSFFRFPKSEDLRKIWVGKCKRNDDFNVDNSRICSRHFQPDAFERDIRSETLGLKPKLILKEDAIPTIHLMADDGQKYVKRLSRIATRAKSKKAAKRIENDIATESCSSVQDKSECTNNTNLIKPTSTSTSASTKTQAQEEDAIAALQNITQCLKNENLSLQQIVDKQNTEILMYRRKIKSLQTQLRSSQRRGLTSVKNKSFDNFEIKMKKMKRKSRLNKRTP